MASAAPTTKRSVSTRLLKVEDIPEVTDLFVATQYGNDVRFFSHHTFNLRYPHSAVPYALTALGGIAAAFKTRSIVKPAAATIGLVAAITGVFYWHWRGIVRGFAHMCLKTQMQPSVLTRDYVDNATHAFVLAEDDETKKIVGCVCIQPFDGSKPAPATLLAPPTEGFTATNCCELIRMCVDPNMQGAGIGPKLMVGIEAEARRLGYEHVFLSTSAAQIPAHKLYTKSGYRLLGKATIYPPALKIPLGLVSFTRKIQ